MKKLILAAALSIGVLSAPAYAKPAFFTYGDGLKKVADLPDVKELRSGQGYVDVGYCYKHLTVMFIPIWNWDEHYCGYINSDTYAKITKEELLAISKELNADTSWDDGKSKLSMWERVWGKVTVVGILLLLMLFSMAKAGNDQEED